MDTAKKDLSKAMRRVREKYKEFIKLCGGMANIEVGTKGAWHVHIVINRIADADVFIKTLGEHGAVTCYICTRRATSKIWPDTSRKNARDERYGEHLRETSYHASRTCLKGAKRRTPVQWRE